MNPENLPEGWEWRELGEVVEFLDHMRIPVKQSEREKRKGPYPYYGANGLIDWIDDYIFDEPLVLLAEDGGFFGSKEHPIAYKIEGKTWVNNHAHVLRPKKGIIDIDYLHRVLSFYDVSPYLSGSTRYKLTKTDASKIPIPLPSMNVQREIAEILEKADSVRRKCKLADEKTSKILQAAFVKMFGDPVRNERGWEVQKIGYFSKIVSGGTPSRKIKEYFNGSTPWVTSVSLNKSYLSYPDGKEYITEDAVENSATHLIKRKSVLFGNRVCVGNVAINLCDICFSQDVLAILYNEEIIIPEYLLFSLLFRKSYFESQTRGSTIKGVTIDIVKNTQIPLPPIDLQQKFANLVKKVEAMRERQAKSREKVETTFQALMQKAFRGKLVA